MSNNNYRIIWSTPGGKFGWSDLTQCDDFDDAIAYWQNHLLGGEKVPIDALIEQIKLTN